MFGPPGSGKGSLSALLTKKLNYPHISTGDILREEAKANNELKEIMDSGQLVPNEKILELVEKRLKREDCKEGFILDGFPRNIGQAEFLRDKDIRIDKVFNLDASEDIIIERLSGRRICPNGEIYHVKFNPPKVEGVCDVDGAKLIQRDDDKPETVKERIKVYKEQTKEVLDFYKDIIVSIDVNRQLDEIFSDICTIIENKV